jgi:hypothetical protein
MTPRVNRVIAPTSCAWFFVFANFGTEMAVMIPMIEMTIRTSASV